MPRITLSSNALALEYKAELRIAANGDDTQRTRQHAVRRLIRITADMAVQANRNDPNRVTNADFNRPAFYVQCGLTPTGELINA